MKNQALLAIDIGTQGIKTALVGTEGNIITSTFCSCNTKLGAEKEIYLDAEEVFHNVTSTIQTVMENSRISPGDVLGVGIDGQMAGIVGIDATGEPVFPYDSGLDKRCESSILQMQTLGEERAIALSGCPIIVAQGAKMHWWKNNHPEAFARTEKLLTITGYIVGRMGGLSPSDSITDYTHIHLTAFADIEKNVWSDELLSLFDIPKEKLPRIANPWDIVGKVTRDCAAQTSLLEGTPIIAGCGDTSASCLGAGLTEEGMALDVAGTASAFTVSVKEYHPDVEEKILIYPRSVLPGQWNPFGFVLGGQSISWFKDHFTPHLTFEELDKQACLTDIGNLFYYPYGAGRICPSEPNFSASWMGMNFTHKAPQLFRSIMEAIGFEYRYYLERMQRLNPTTVFSNVTAIGGGAKSEGFSQIKCDITGLPYQITTLKDTPLAAMAAITGFSVGVYPDIVSGLKLKTGLETKLKPAKNSAFYDAKYSKYFEAIPYLRGIYK